MKPPDKANQHHQGDGAPETPEEISGGNHIPLIPYHILESALAAAALPASVRKVGAFTVDIYEAIDAMKAAKKDGEELSANWSWLRLLLDEAALANDWSVFDDLSSAWTKLNPVKSEPGVSVEPVAPRVNYPVRAPLAWIVVESIRQLQRDLERVPFRHEILDYVTFYRPDQGMDEAELSRQLKKLELSPWIPHVGSVPFPQQAKIQRLIKVLPPSGETGEKKDPDGNDNLGGAQDERPPCD